MAPGWPTRHGERAGWQRLENNAEPNGTEDPPLTAVPCLAPQLPMVRVNSWVPLRAATGRLAVGDSSVVMMWAVRTR